MRFHFSYILYGRNFVFFFFICLKAVCKPFFFRQYNTVCSKCFIFSKCFFLPSMEGLRTHFHPHPPPLSFLPWLRPRVRSIPGFKSVRGLPFYCRFRQTFKICLFPFFYSANNTQPLCALSFQPYQSQTKKDSVQQILCVK